MKLRKHMKSAAMLMALSLVLTGLSPAVGAGVSYAAAKEQEQAEVTGGSEDEQDVTGSTQEEEISDPEKTGPTDENPSEEPDTGEEPTEEPGEGPADEEDTETGEGSLPEGTGEEPGAPGQPDETGDDKTPGGDENPAVGSDVEEGAEDAAQEDAPQDPEDAPNEEGAAGAEETPSEPELSDEAVGSLEGSLTADVVESMIDALPDIESLRNMEAEELDQAIMDISLAMEAYESLSAEEQEKVENADKLTKLLEAISSGIETTTEGTTRDDVKYIDENGELCYANDVTVVTADTSFTDGWYLVDGTVEVPDISVESGNTVHLILGDGAELTVDDKRAIIGGSLNIYAQSEGAGAGGLKTYRRISLKGELVINGGCLDLQGENYYVLIEAESTNARLIINGGDIELYAYHNGCITSGYVQNGKIDIEINGGKVNVEAGDGNDEGNMAIGIRGATNTTLNLTVNDGELNVKGSDCPMTSGYPAIGIMSGGDGTVNVTINGGKVTAKGGGYAVAIGAQSPASSVNKSVNLTVNGGELIAEGGKNGGAGIGSIGRWANDGEIKITGGKLTAIGTGGKDGIGEKGDLIVEGDGIIYANSIKEDMLDEDAASGIIFTGEPGQENGKVYGEVKLDEDLVLESGQSLVVPSGSSLTMADGAKLDASASSNGITNEGNFVGELEGTTSGSGETHIPADDWSWDNSYHWKDCSVVDCQDGHAFYKAEHELSGDACTICGYVVPKDENSENGSDNGSGGGTSYGSTYSTGGTYYADGRSNAASQASDVTPGSWDLTADGSWMYRLTDGSYAANTWIKAMHDDRASWYRFDEAGRLIGGWYTDASGNTYFLHDLHDGRYGFMYTGWQTIGGRTYFFSMGEQDGLPEGAMLKNTTTPDGHVVGEDGAWTGQ